MSKERESDHVSWTEPKLYDLHVNNDLIHVRDLYTWGLDTSHVILFLF